MTRPKLERRHLEPAIRRLHAVAGLDVASISALERAAEKSVTLRARHELLTEGRLTPAPILILDGWAARVRIVLEGRRQVIGFVLPGEIVGNCGYEGAHSASTVVALTEMVVCALPQDSTPQLDRAYAISRALDEAYLLAQVVRLGRLDAAERIIDLLLELHDRLEVAGLATSGRYEFPITQELFADALGLTSVHVNRTVQQARKRGDLVWAGRTMRLTDVDHSRRLIGTEIAKVG